MRPNRYQDYLDSPDGLRQQIRDLIERQLEALDNEAFIVDLPANGGSVSVVRRSDAMHGLLFVRQAVAGDPDQEPKA